MGQSVRVGNKNRQLWGNGILRPFMLQTDTNLASLGKIMIMTLLRCLISGNHGGIIEYAFGITVAKLWYPKPNHDFLVTVVLLHCDCCNLNHQV